jgi:TPR repeat protein
MMGRSGNRDHGTDASWIARAGINGIARKTAIGWVWRVGIALLLAGCTAGGGTGQAVLPEAPAELAPITGAAHRAALADQHVQAGQIAVGRHDMATAASEYGQAAKAGNPVGSYFLAAMYEAGAAAPPDAAAVVRLLYAAALSGYAPAQTSLGDHYDKGRGVQRDPVRALAWYRLAAQAGEDIGTARLALALLEGTELPRDVNSALRVLQHCADPVVDNRLYQPNGYDGGPGCQYMLATLYDKGLFGVTVDRVAAMKWYNKSAGQHMPLAEKYLADYYEHGPHGSNDYDFGPYWQERASQDAENGPGHWTIP